MSANTSVKIDSVNVNSPALYKQMKDILLSSASNIRILRTSGGVEYDTLGCEIAVTQLCNDKQSQHKIHTFDFEATPITEGSGECVGVTIGLHYKQFGCFNTTRILATLRPIAQQ